MMAWPALPGNYSIRAAEIQDVPVLLNLIRELAAHQGLEREVSASEAALRVGLFGERPYAEACIAETEGNVVGFALYFHTFSTFLGKPGLYLEDLFVREEYRGLGFGEALLRHVGKVAVERGCGRLEWVALDWNEPAIGFYRKLGAVPLHEQTTYRVSGPALRRLAEGAS